jgi:hypothetical protein
MNALRMMGVIPAMPGKRFYVTRHLEIESSRVHAVQAAGEDVAVARGSSHPMPKQSPSYTRLYRRVGTSSRSVEATSSMCL